MRISAPTIIAVVCALGIGLMGRQPPGHHWSAVRPGPQDGTNAFDLCGHDGTWDEMSGAPLPAVSHMVADVCGRDSRGEVLIARSDYSESDRGLRTFFTAVQTTAGDTLGWLDDRALICALPARGDTHDLLVWYPEVWLSRAGEADTDFDPARVFSDIVRKDARFRADAAFFHAVHLASSTSRIDSACRVAVVTPGGAEVRTFDFDPRFTPGAGTLFETNGERVVLVETDTAHANSDMFSVLFEQPDIADGEALVARDSDDIEGSYRGLVAVAPDAGGVLWYRRLGVMCLKCHLVDLDRDGVDEILLESYGIENDVAGGGTTDAGTAYLICLDQGGNILWRKRVLGRYCGVQAAAADLLGDDDLEVVMTWSSGRYEQVGGIAVLDASGRTLLERTDMGGLYGLVVTDLDGDGRPEIATGGPGGIVSVLDEALEPEATREMAVELLDRADGGPEFGSFAGSGVPWKRRAIPVGAADITQDGVPELLILESLWSRWDLPDGGVVRCGRGDLVVTSAALDEILRAPIDARVPEAASAYPTDIPASMKMAAFPLDHDGDGTDEIALWARPGFTFCYWGTHDG